MFYIPKWKEFLIWLSCLVAIYCAIPSIFMNSKCSLLDYFPKNKVNLGLDLKGGVSILLEADLENYKKELIEQSFSQLKSQLSSQNKRILDFTSSKENSSIILKVKDNTPQEDYKQVVQEIKSILGSSFKIQEKENHIILSINQDSLAYSEEKIMEQSIEIIRKRIDEKGAKEIDLQKQGNNQILLQVPGAESPEQIKRLLGRTAKLSFHLVDLEASKKLMSSFTIPPFGFKFLPFVSDDKSGNRPSGLIVESRAMLTGEMLIDAQVSVNLSKPVVSFKLNSVGSKIFAQVSSKNTGKPFAIVLDNEIISAPVINEPIIGGAGMISGNFSMESANELALLLRSGALVTPINIIEERVVGPNLGSDSIKAGSLAIIVGALIVILFMIVFYGFFGFVADLALIMNIFFIFTLLSFLDATLTLPGLAGIVLTLGMAVDSNVLICERIKEELRAGKNILSSITNGYKAAFLTIVDSNVTTVIAGLALYFFGSGPIKGFAVTLIIGIFSSMFTSVLLSKILLKSWYKIFRTKYLKLM